MTADDAQLRRQGSVADWNISDSSEKKSMQRPVQHSKPPADAIPNGQRGPEADGFNPGDGLAGSIPGNEGQMLQQKVKEDSPGSVPTPGVGTSGASTERHAASQLHDEAHLETTKSK